MVNPFAPGGGVDAFGRPLSIYLSNKLGSQFLVENLARAGGTVGAANAARRAGDGYNFFLGAVHHTIAESLYTKLPYSLEQDFVPITVLAYVPNVVVMHPKNAQIGSIRELIAYAKANPGKLNYGSAGNGTTHHLAGELFKTMAGVNLTHIPYKGAGPMMQDLLAGQVDMAFDGMGTSAPQIKAGRLKALAVTTAQRSFVDPSVPTMQEAGMPGYIVTTWYALWAVKGTPKEALDRMYQETVKALQSPELKVVWEAQGATAGGEPPAEFTKLIHSEIAKWAKVVKDAGAKVDN
jgi:tripartite-type tricarboxylate transporter receptor subunit TctC